jgi:hypothetical protein
MILNPAKKHIRFAFDDFTLEGSTSRNKGSVAMYQYDTTLSKHYFHFQQIHSIKKNQTQFFTNDRRLNI